MVETWARDRRPWFARVLALIAGAAAAFAQPPWGFLPGLLGYGLMLWLVERSPEPRPLRSAFFRGWLTGLGYFVVSVWWIAEPFQIDAREQGWMAPFAVALVSMFMALFWGAAAIAYRAVERFPQKWELVLRSESAQVFESEPVYPDRVDRTRSGQALAGRGVVRVLLFAAALSLAEWLRGHILTGFPWDLPGETWAAGSAPSQAAALVGAYGLTWITVAAFAAPAVLREGWRGRGATILAVLTVAALYGFGAARLARASRANVAGPWVRVVQADVKQENKYDQRLFADIVDRYVTLTARPGGRIPDIVVWPEGAIPAALNEYLAPGAWTHDAIAGALSPEQTLLLGGYRYGDDAAGRPVIYNSLAVVRRGAAGLAITGVYDKYRLVPFGEFMPLDSLAARLGIKQLVHVGDGFAPGPRPRPLPLPGLPTVQPLICYEALYSGFTRDGARLSGRRAAWIVNISNDAWFGTASGPRQHLNMASYRAIEEGLPMVRATPTGISAFIDAFGRVVPGETLGEGAFGVIDAPLPPALPPTPFDRWGDGAFWLMLIVSLAGTRWRRLGRKADD